MGLETLDHLYIWGAAALLLFWGVGAYNRLVRLRSEALRSFGVLSPMLQRSADLVLATVIVAPVSAPAAAPDASATTSAEGAPAAAVHLLRPASPWTGVQGAATQFMASLAVARTKPLDADAMAALSAAGVVLRMAWQRMAAECATLTGAPLPQAAVWDDLTRHTDDATLLFTQAVQDYNAAIGQFPAMLLAGLVGFRQARVLDMSLP
ncbi:LemA family protein [Variovorax sp. HJSM1_2]|uniref:LemA family protein n=1 Tax=Variovorax sp. HJSM1_2 TaxID=3366263 RepID=UPI003BBF19F1